MSRAESWGGLLMGIVIVGAVALITLTVVEPMRAAAEHENWSRGYCTALGGEWITATVCNVDGKVVPIPESEE